MQTIQHPLTCRRVAFVVTDGFEPTELHRARDAVIEAGGHAVVLTPDGRRARPHSASDASPLTADEAIGRAEPSHFDAVVLAGGVIADEDFSSEPVHAFVGEIAALDRPVIASGAWAEHPSVKRSARVTRQEASDLEGFCSSLVSAVARA